jgi:hypothetical protein
VIQIRNKVDRIKNKETRRGREVKQVAMSVPFSFIPCTLLKGTREKRSRDNTGLL